MRKFLAGFGVVFGAAALTGAAISVPATFNPVFNSGVFDGGLTVFGPIVNSGALAADAGSIGALQATQFVADAGQVNGLNIGISAAPAVTADSSGNATLNASAGQTVTLAVNGAGVLACNASTGCSSGYIMQLSDLRVGGSSSTVLTNIGPGSCTLSSGQCNAVVPNANGSSLCVASVQGTSQTLVGCDVRPDAGSATAFCNASAVGTAAIICFN